MQTSANPSKNNKTEKMALLKLESKSKRRPYEAVIILKSSVSEEDAKTLFRRNKDVIEKQFSGEVYHLDTWGKRVLANPIGSHKKAVYFHTTFYAEPGAISELERTMRINENVLRAVHTRLEDGVELAKFVETFKEGLKESATRERERESKFQARRAARAGGGPKRGPGERSQRDGRGDFRDDDESE